MTDNKVITSPEGTLHFASVKDARKNSFSGRTEYSIRIEIDGDTKGADEFRKTLKKINKNLIVEEDAKLTKEGNYIINARSRDKPKVFDKQMNRLDDEEVPMIESGTARVLVTPFEGKAGKGGGLNLAGVQLLDIVEYQGSEPVDEDTLLEALKQTKK